MSLSSGQCVLLIFVYLQRNLLLQNSKSTFLKYGQAVDVAWRVHQSLKIRYSVHLNQEAGNLKRGLKHFLVYLLQRLWFGEETRDVSCWTQMFLPTDPTEDKDETISQAGLSSAETFKKEHNMLFEREEVWKNISVNNKIREGGDSPLALRRLPYGHGAYGHALKKLLPTGAGFWQGLWPMEDPCWSRGKVWGKRRDREKNYECNSYYSTLLPRLAWWCGGKGNSGERVNMCPDHKKNKKTWRKRC